MSSEHQKTTQAVLSNMPVPKDHQTVERFALFLADGTPVSDLLAGLPSVPEDLGATLSAIQDTLDDHEARLAALETPPE